MGDGRLRRVVVVDQANVLHAAADILVDVVGAIRAGVAFVGDEFRVVVGIDSGHRVSTCQLGPLDRVRPVVHYMRPLLAAQRVKRRAVIVELHHVVHVIVSQDIVLHARFLVATGLPSRLGAHVGAVADFIVRDEHAFHKITDDADAVAVLLAEPINAVVDDPDVLALLACGRALSAIVMNHNAVPGEPAEIAIADGAARDSLHIGNGGEAEKAEFAESDIDIIGILHRDRSMFGIGLDKFPRTLRHGGAFGAGAIPASLSKGKPFEADIAHLVAGGCAGDLDQPFQHWHFDGGGGHVFTRTRLVVEGVGGGIKEPFALGIEKIDRVLDKVRNRIGRAIPETVAFCKNRTVLRRLEFETDLCRILIRSIGVDSPAVLVPVRVHDHFHVGEAGDTSPAFDGCPRDDRLLGRGVDSDHGEIRAERFRIGLIRRSRPDGRGGIHCQLPELRSDSGFLEDVFHRIMKHPAA